jgi:hypothetical protein
MIVHRRYRTTAEAAKPRRAAHWIVVAAVLALQWAVTPFGPIPTAEARFPIIVAAKEVSRPLAPSSSAQIELTLPTRDLVTQSDLRLPDDDVIAVRLAHRLEYGSSLCASAACADPRPAFPRGFNPRAPPLRA